MPRSPSATASEPSGAPSLEFESLRALGIRLLERLAGTEWTDFNTHDPGITILEQVCWALTDLGYRLGHPIPDILAEGGAPGRAALCRRPPPSAASRSPSPTCAG